MKRASYFFLCILFAFAVASCAPSSSGKNGNSNLPDPASFRQQDNMKFFIETGSCYYCMLNDKVYFSEKDQPEFFLLCSKPNCTHNGSDCNAYADSGLGYSDGYLYGAVLFGGDPHLFQMSLDGSERRRIATIEMPVNPAGTAGGAYEIYFHDGYAYYSVTNEGLNAFFRVELATGKSERILESLLRGDTQLGVRVRFVGSKIYFLLYEQTRDACLYEANTNTLEYRKVRKWSSEICDWAVFDDVLYYYASDRGTFCEYNLNTGEETTCLQLDYYGGAANYDDDYIYLTTWDDDDFGGKGLSIFDQNYQFLQRVSYRPNQELLYITQDKLIFTDLPSQKATKYLPKSAIGTGKAELLPIEDPYSYR